MLGTERDTRELERPIEDFVTYTHMQPVRDELQAARDAEKQPLSADRLHDILTNKFKVARLTADEIVRNYEE